MRILIAGPGVIGASLALGCAVHGHETVVLGRRQESLKRARLLMERAAAELKDSGLAPRDFSGWSQRVEFTTRLSDVARNTELVVEAIIEDLQAKQQLFQELEAHFPTDTVFASSTSGLPVDDLSARCDSPSRIAVAHFANPPHLMPVVEIVPGSESSADAMATLVNFVESLGKLAVQLKHDLPGHIFNRIQFAMLREAIEEVPQTRFDRAHFVEYGDFALIFEIVYYVLSPDYGVYMDAQQAINLGIHRRFEEARVSFAYPTQELILRRGAGQLAAVE